jgi:hypothetical protein
MNVANMVNQEIIVSTVSIEIMRRKKRRMSIISARKAGPASTLFVQKIAEVAWSLFELKHLIEYGTEPDFSQQVIYVGSAGHSFELIETGDGYSFWVGGTNFVFDSEGKFIDYSIPTGFRSERQWIDWLHVVEAGL